MKKYILLLVAFLIIFPLSVSADRVYLIEIDGEIKAGTVQYVNRAIREAESGQADYLVITIDTPGGLVDSTRKIVNSMIESNLEIVVFVGKKNGWAYSAGSFILMASDHAFVHPEASIGAAEPRVMGEGDTKMIEAMASWIGSLATANERDSETAKRFVTENLTLNGAEALALGVIDGTAVDLNELFTALGLIEPETISIQPSWFEEIFNLLSHPYLVSLFLTLGVLGLVFAFRTGEFEITGMIGLMLLAIGLWGIGVINFNVLGITLLFLGIFLLSAEFFGGPGFGALGILGIISLLLGIFNFGAEPFLSPRVFDFATLFTIGVLTSLLILFIILSKGVARTFGMKPTTGPESLLDKRGRVIALGRVDVDGESWSARNEGDEPMEKGIIVRIIKVEGNTLIVRPMKNKEQ